MSTLLLGDSHVAGTPGRALIRLLGGEATREGRAGWGTRAWMGMGRDRMVEALGARPTRVIYMFGTNDQPTEKTRAAMQALKALAHQYGAKDVWFIGAPSYPDPERHEQARKLNALARGVYGSKHIDSQNIVTRSQAGRAADGIHFTVTGARPWAQCIMNRLRASSWLPYFVVGGAIGLLYAFTRSTD